MARTVLGALGTVFGLQALRAFFPLLVYVLRDRWGLASVTLGEIAAAVFASAFLMPALAARLGPRRALPAIGLALTAARALVQAASDSPVLGLALAATTVVAFLAFLGALARDGGVSPGRALLAGGLLDAVIHATAGTRDLHWGGPFADAATWALVAVAGFAALHELRGDSPDAPPRLSAGAGLLALGPFLLLQLEQLGNVARLSARADLPTGTSGAIVAGGLAGGLLLAGHWPRRGFWGGAPTLLVAAVLLGRGLWWSGVGGPLAAPTLVATQLAGAVLLVRALDGRRAARGTVDAAAFGGGFLLFFVLFFAHYAGYDLAIPLSRTVLFLVAGAVLLVASAAAPAPSAPAARLSAARVALLTGLATLPLTRPFLAPALLTDGGPRPGARPGHVAVGEPIRVVTFNLHAGFDEAGGFALDEMLLALRRQDPDVVALQEVSRGWVINGSADLFELARESLGLEGVSAPSIGGDWGNAVFTRWPPKAARNEPIPPPDLRLRRAVALVDLEAPEDATRELRILATHLHYRSGDDAIRDRQARFIVDELSAPPDTMPSILLGDFNAEPGSTCLAILEAAGWRDALASSGELTYPSTDPVRRIDTILLRGPWRVLSARVAPPWGSDHRAVIAEILLEHRLEISAPGRGS